MCALEAFKVATNTAGYLDNYTMYSGGEGLYTYTFSYERKPDCPVCGTRTVTLAIPHTMTLEEFVDRLANDATLYALSFTTLPVLQFMFRHCKQPSILGPKGALYVVAPPTLEQALRGNLVKTMGELIESGDEISVTDPNLNHTLHLSINFS